MSSMVSAEFVDCASLPPGSLVDVETKNRHYRIECLGDSVIRISGHPELCPEPVTGQLRGSAERGGILTEPGLIGRGKYLQFLLDDRRPVTTSRVMRVRVRPAVH
jgi:hypothetical protein